MPITKVTNLVNKSVEVNKIVAQIVEQLVQETCLGGQVIALNDYQIKWLKLSQVLDRQISQVDRYIAQHYFELIGVYKVLDPEAPIAALTPIYHDYMVQVLEYLPYNLLPSMSSDARIASQAWSRNNDCELIGTDDG